MNTVVRGFLCISLLGVCLPIGSKQVFSADRNETVQDVRIVYAEELAELCGRLSEHNLSIDRYLDHPSFRRHHDIDTYFRKSAELITFVDRKSFDMFSLRSSYAGAIGSMQFLPSSLNRWFVGTSLTDMNDAIESVANYLGYFNTVEGNIEKAVFKYNPSILYVKTVLELADNGK